MLLFNKSVFIKLFHFWHFNTSNVTIQPIQCELLSELEHYFNTSNVTIQQKMKMLKPSGRIYFNTSNVTIQHWCRSELVHCTRISIHLMLLFNWLWFYVKVFWCIISIHLMLLFNAMWCRFQSCSAYFNTSNVTIQLTEKEQTGDFKIDFNTSNVTIQPQRGLYSYAALYFNTSNVTIQPSICSWKIIIFIISIHLMLLFNYKIWLS